MEGRKLESKRALTISGGCYYPAQTSTTNRYSLITHTWLPVRLRQNRTFVPIFPNLRGPEVPQTTLNHIRHSQAAILSLDSTMPWLVTTYLCGPAKDQMKMKLGLHSLDGKGSKPRNTHVSMVFESQYRLLGFGACLLGAAVCFFVAFLTMLRCVTRFF